MNDLMVYEGNWPGNVNRDAKYSVRSEGGQHVVGIEYRTNDGEKWSPTTDAHDDLVKMVNGIKTEAGGRPGGAFYINEYRQVIVPAGPAGYDFIYYLGSEYAEDLIFDFEGYKISGKPYDLNGNPLHPGDAWKGPHAGIPFKLKAGGRDISYEKQIRPKVRKEFTLSSYVGDQAAQRVAAKIRAIVGFDGGRFYINEFRQLFTGMPYIYIGELETDDPWFPKPHS